MSYMSSGGGIRLRRWFEAREYGAFKLLEECKNSTDSSVAAHPQSANKVLTADQVGMIFW